MKTKYMDFEQVFMLRDTVEAAMNTPMFVGDRAYAELYTEADQVIAQTTLPMR